MLEEVFENRIIQILSLLATILTALLGFALYRHRKLAKYYFVRSKKSSSLRRKDVLGIRAKRISVSISTTTQEIRTIS